MPYISRNISEFWKRWHISLSSWLKEYLYISLGGNRKGATRTYINLMITMILGGLWHGASWTFVFWGFLHGVALCIHKAIAKSSASTGNACRTFFNIIGTYIFVSVAWIFFRAENFSNVLAIFRNMFVWDHGIIQVYMWTVVGAILLSVSTLFAIRKHHGSAQGQNINGYYPSLNLAKLGPLVIVIFATGLMAGLAYTGTSPFIYFQF
jgi:alginate O-acetyltransferase complex protein AlgI